jgi:hypothetical protein
MGVLIAAFIVGCEENEKVDTGKYTHTLTIPDTAKVVAEGNGELSFRAPDDGRIWVMDADTGKVISSKRVREGQKFTLNPEANSAMLDSQKVISQDLKRKDKHQLYFEKE